MIATLAAAAGLGACGGSGGDAASPEVASLGTEPQASTPDGSVAEDVPTDPEEARLAFTECMREHGIDMPDPSADGGPVQFEFDASNDAEAERFETAQEECAKYMEAVRGEIEIDPEQQKEMREQLLEMAECMREHGIDMPDPQFDDDGGVRVQIGEPGSGRPQLDPEDDEVQAALEECGGDGQFRLGGPANGSEEDDDAPALDEDG